MNDSEKYPIIKRASRKKLRTIAQVFSVLSIILSALIFYDVFLYSPINEKAIIIDKYSTHAKGSPFRIIVKGTKRYLGSVEEGLFSKANVGDEVYINISRFFEEIKSVELLKNGRVTASSKGFEVNYLLIYGIFFIFTLFSFKKEEYFYEKSNWSLLLVILSIEFISFFFWIDLLT